MTSKTDEAERLREEVARMYPDGVMAGEYKQSYKLEKSDEIINKVLDAFENEYLKHDPYFEDDAKEAFYKAMDKLREKQE